uniref:Uncharacterized protein n=1 Tax=Mola mola TaxID=94237 RepID=A0A3Q3W482_MOLML
PLNIKKKKDDDEEEKITSERLVIYESRWSSSPPPAGHSDATDDSASPSAGGSGLLSLPWEMVSHIASHLPAQCVITVLPKVCHALGNVGKDSTTWQLRARRLVGSRASFPVGPREDFDWPSACLEMEQLITCWTDQAHLVARQTKQDEEREPIGEAQRARRDVEPAAEGQEEEQEDEGEGVGVVAQEVAYGVDEGMEVALEGEDGEIQPIGCVDQLERLREISQERHLAGRRILALERIALPPEHFAQINSVLLLGGEGAVCASGSRDWNVKLWDLQTGDAKLLHTLLGQGAFSTHRGWVWCLASQGPMLASGGFDSTVRLWDLQAGGAERGLIRAGASVHCLSYQSDVLLAGTFDKRVNMYDPRAAGPLVKSLRLHGNAVMCLAADEKYILSGSTDSTVAVYDRRAGKALKRLRLNSYLVSMSYSGCELWAGDNTGMLHSFSFQAGTLQPLSQFDVGHRARITGIHRSPGSLYTCSSDHAVKIHIPCAPPRTLCTLQHQDAVTGLSVQAGVLAFAFGDAYAEIWRPRK